MTDGTAANPPPPSRVHRLRELAFLFLRLGTTAFGGPAAHLGMMEEEVVKRRKWITHEEFLDMLGAANIIPGPTSTEMTAHIGHRRGGFLGLIVAGACFILPAALIVAALAWAYMKWGRIPQMSGMFVAVKAVVIAILVQAMWRLGRAAIKTPLLLAIALAAAGLNFFGAAELAVLFGAAIFAAAARWFILRRHRPAAVAPCLAIAPLVPLPLATAAAAAPFALGWLFLISLKIGAVLFGGGYVLVAFLRADLVHRFGWLSESQLLDAVAVGQITPGPLFTTATFIGYILGGPMGAILATIGIFLPGFIFVAVSSPFIPHLRKSPMAGAFLDGLNVASVALLAVVSWQLGRATLTDWWTIAIAAVSLAILLLTRINSAWLVLLAAVGGIIFTLIA